MNNEEAEPLKKAFRLNNWKGWEDNDRLCANIIHSQKGNMHLYNYNNAVLVDRNHPVLVKCRGIVVDDNGKVLNYPFDDRNQVVEMWRSLGLICLQVAEGDF